MTSGFKGLSFKTLYLSNFFINFILNSSVRRYESDKDSFIGWASESVALFADTIHNFGDAATTFPLGLAFFLSRNKPNKRFTYGYGRAKDIAGLIIVFLILFSAAVAAHESISRFFFPQPVEFLGGVIAASIVGFLRDELVAKFRIKVGMKIGRQLWWPTATTRG